MPLSTPTSELAALITQRISPADVEQYAFRTWPGRSLLGLTVSDFMPPKPIKIGSLRWPTGASRWAVGHFLATSAQMEAIIAKGVYAQTTGTNPLQAELVMNDGRGGEIRTLLYPLAFRPLERFGIDTLDAQPEANGLYLLTFVDERYYWWSATTAGIALTAASTWATLYDYLAARLVLTTPLPSRWSRDDVHAEYGRPDNHSELNEQYQTVPQLLDAVAYNVGHKICRRLNGTVKACSYATARTDFLQNLARTHPRLAGGKHAWPLPQVV